MSESPSPSATRTAAALALFSEVCDLAGDERRRALEQGCGGDDALRAEVEALLVADAADSREELGPLRLAMAVAETPGRLGPFTLLDELGRGGMGTVYRARQERPARDVAVKVLDGRRLSGAARRRFDLEVELLGRLDHEGIARIHAAAGEGPAPDEPPWFAMELVEGRPLLEHAARQRLSRDERLGLFVRVCDAVEHAHRHGVIHRDLKSANVLVTAAGRPKVLDFGVARAADHDVRATSELTAAGHIIGTLSCMSPEQARGDAEAVDTRTDVYALGVLLYQLLCDEPPVPLDDVGVTEAVRRIVEEPPVPLAHRDRSLAGDLDVITGKALQKEPAHRYGSPGALADDLRRHLAHRPILAAPPDTLDRVLRFVRRQRLLVSAAGLLLAVLVGASLVSFSWWREAEDGRQAAESARVEADRRRGDAERARADAQVALQAAHEARLAAELETDRLSQLYAFLKDVLGADDPNLARGRDLTVAQAVDRAAARFAAEPTDEPSLRASLHVLLADVYGDLSLVDEAVEQYRAAQALVDAHGPELLPAVTRARILEHLGFLLATRLELAEAEARYTQLLALTRTDASLPRALEGHALRGLASITHRPLALRLADAEAALVIAREQADDVGLGMTLDRLAALLAAGGEGGRALEVAAESLALGLRIDVPSRVMQASYTLALLYGHAGDPLAHEHTTRMLGVLDAVLGRDHPQTANFLIEVTRAWCEGSGELSGPGWERLRGAPASLGPAAGAVHPQALTALTRLLWQAGELGPARATLELALAPYRDRPGGDVPPTDPAPGSEAALLASMLQLEADLERAAAPPASTDGVAEGEVR